MPDLTPAERLKKIEADFAQAEQYGQGCDGCGCSCCGAVKPLLYYLALAGARG